MILIELGESLNCIAHSIEADWHKVELNKFGMFVTHVIDSDTGNSIIFMIDVLIVHLEEVIYKGIWLGSFLKHMIHKLFVFRDFEDEIYPDEMGLWQGLVGFLWELIGVETNGHMRK